MEEILFYTPLLITIKQKEVDDIPTMLMSWKDEFLTGWNLKVWQQLEKNQRPSSIKKFIYLVRMITKWFWPALMLSLIAYFSIGPALFLAIGLLPIQIMLFVYLLAKLYSFVCVAAAFNLNNNLKKVLSRS